MRRQKDLSETKKETKGGNLKISRFEEIYLKF